MFSCRAEKTPFSRSIILLLVGKIGAGNNAPCMVKLANIFGEMRALRMFLKTCFFVLLGFKIFSAILKSLKGAS